MTAIKIHQGEDFELLMNPEFNIHLPFQEVETLLLPFKDDNWNRERDELVMGGRDPLEATRLIIRSRHRIRVTITDGVLWSSSREVICEGLGKVRTMRQAEIQRDWIFCSTPPRPTTIRKAEQARIESQRLEEEEMDEDFAMRAHTQAKPMTRIPLQRSASFPQAEEPTASSSSTAMQIDEPRPSTSARARREGEIARQVGMRNLFGGVTTHNDLINATQIIKAFFSDQLFEQFNVGFDKHAANITEVQPNGQTVQDGYKHYHTREGMTTTNTTRMGSEVFEGRKVRGQLQPPVQAQLVLYKSKNNLTGNRVNFSVREGAQILDQIVHNMIDCLEKLANYHKDQAVKEANKKSGQEKEEAILRAMASFAEKQEKLGN